MAGILDVLKLVRPFLMMTHEADILEKTTGHDKYVRVWVRFAACYG